MQLPKQLKHNKKASHKNTFGHVLVLAGSKHMLGAGALVSLATMRSGAGLTTWGVPKSLNQLAQKKTSNIVMTKSLAETQKQSIALTAYKDIKDQLPKYNAIAIGPGLSQESSTQKFVHKLIETASVPMVIDADALRFVAQDPTVLIKTNTAKVLTPHVGEMSALMSSAKNTIESNRKLIAEKFSKQYHCTLLLKGAHTVVASPGKRTYTNKTGNPGMATAGSGDVLTGIIAAFLAQGLHAHDAAKFGSYIHGLAGDCAAKQKTAIAMIASDIIDALPEAFGSFFPK